MCRAMLSKSLIQFFVDGWDCVPSLLFDLRPDYGGGNEDNGDLLQKVPFRHCCTQCPQPCSRPPPTHTSTGHSWANLGQSLVGVTAPFPLPWGTQGFACAHQGSLVGMRFDFKHDCTPYHLVADLPLVVGHLFWWVPPFFCR